MKGLMKLCLPIIMPIIIVALLISGVIASLEDDEEKQNGSAYGTYSSASGEEIVAYARQFVGNPYVYGGTSLTDGIDCSAFVMVVYAHFGISLPRTASEQSRVGQEVKSLDDMVPGDIITYHSGGSPSGWHVGIYDGKGYIVEAQSSSAGITDTRVANHGTIMSIRRFVTDAKMSDGGGGGTVTGEKGELLGNFKLTGYCNCSICCGKWAGGATASGVMPTAHRTVAISKGTAQKYGLTFGDKLLIINNGIEYTYVYEDGGDSNMAGNNWIDVYVGSHSEAYSAYCNTSGYTAEVYRLE